MQVEIQRIPNHSGHWLIFVTNPPMGVPASLTVRTDGGTPAFYDDADPGRFRVWTGAYGMGHDILATMRGLEAGTLAGADATNAIAKALARLARIG
jgi:hypothetical protein